jgi:hypothetical protein
MTYRVVFEKRSRTDGEPSALDPTLELDNELPEGVVADKNLVEWLESDAQHSQETLDEDDAFLAMASAEVWEYEIISGKDEEFQDAMKRSKVVLEYTITDEAETLPEDALPKPLRQAVTIRSGMGDASEAEGPGSQVTGDASAGGSASHSTDDGSESLDEGGRDDLRFADADDPALGLTDSDAASDWAANTGPSRGPGRGVKTRDLTDKSSTLRPGKR